MVFDSSWQRSRFSHDMGILGKYEVVVLGAGARWSYFWRVVLVITNVLRRILP
jgi:hypothetical protein